MDRRLPLIIVDATATTATTATVSNHARMVKEVESYEKEAKDQEAKVQKMRDDGKDFYDIRKQVSQPQPQVFQKKVYGLSLTPLIVALPSPIVPGGGSARVLHDDT